MPDEDLKLTAEEKAHIAARRKEPELQLSPEEKSLVTGRRAALATGRTWSDADLEPGNWAKLSDERQNQIRQAIAAALPT